MGLELAVEKADAAAERGGPSRQDGLACGEEQCSVEHEQANRVQEYGRPREGLCIIMLVSAALDGDVSLEPLAADELVARKSIYTAHGEDMVKMSYGLSQRYMCVQIGRGGANRRRHW